MNAAQLELDPDFPGARESDLKQEVANRLAEHRARRARATAPAAGSTPAPAPAPRRGRSAEIAAAVAERYSNSPSYRAVLAAESARSLHEAEAAAEVASINARAIARAQQQLLAELGGWDEPQAPLNTVPLTGPLPLAEPGAAAAVILAQQTAARSRATALPPAPPPAVRKDPFTEDFAEPLTSTRPKAEVNTPAYTVRLYEDAGRPLPTPAPVPRPASSAPLDLDSSESLLLDEEIAFRYDPVLADAAPPEPLPANLIEFPRQLVAARKARPRLAEGPLRDEAATTDASQLRIFEVEAQHISAAPAAEAAAPEWTSILLPPQPVSTFFEPLDTDYVPSLVPQTAPIPRRLLASAVDFGLIGFCTAGAISLFVWTTTHLTHLPLTLPRTTAFAAGFGAFVALAALFHLLFFTLSDSTPGMRYARIAFCTFSDENPTRAEVRRRLLAVTISAFPLGLGFLWAFLDEDRLGWHDRISRMYPRAY